MSGIRVTSYQGVDPRRFIAGFLAGISIVLFLLLIFALLVFTGGFWETLRDVSFQIRSGHSFWSLLLQSLKQTLLSFPSYLWSARNGFFVMGILGIILAFIDEIGNRLRLLWAENLGLVVLVAILSFSTTTGAFIWQEKAVERLANNPGLFYDLRSLLVSNTTWLFMAILTSLAFSYLIWISWIWWQDFWCRVFGTHRPTGETNTATSFDTSTYSRGNSSSKIGIAFVLLAAIATIALLKAYSYHSSKLITSELWITKDSPRGEVLFSFKQDPEFVVASNVAGRGNVNFDVLAKNQNLIIQNNTMKLSESPNSYSSVKLPLQGNTPGDFLVKASLISGEGGLIRFVAVDGSTSLALVLAVLIGFCVSLAMTSLLVTFLSYRARESKHAL